MLFLLPTLCWSFLSTKQTVLDKDMLNEDDLVALHTHWANWRLTRKQLINAQQQFDVQCIYLPILQDAREDYIARTRDLAVSYVRMAKELQKRYADFSDKEKMLALQEKPTWDINRFEEGEMWTVRQTIFNHRYGPQCSYIFDSKQFNEFAETLDASNIVKLHEYVVQFPVGVDWGLELDERSGEVFEVTPGGIADKKGVRVGHFVWAIDDDKDFIYRHYMWLLHIMNELKPFGQFKFDGRVTFRSISWLDKNGTEIKAIDA